MGLRQVRRSTNYGTTGIMQMLDFSSIDSAVDMRQLISRRTPNK